MVYKRKMNIDSKEINLSWTKLKDIIKLCNPWEQFVLVEKYWLINWKTLPMQQIWSKFDMSRERIRQILNKSLWKIRRFISNDEYLNNIITKAQNIIKQNGYILWEEQIINTLLEDKDIKLNYNELLLILSSDYDLYYIHRNKRFKRSFFIEPLFEDLISDIHDTTFNFLKKNKEAIDKKTFIDKLIPNFSAKFQRNQSIKDVLENEKLYKKIFTISKDIYQFNNKLGLEKNKEVNPKTIKLKIKHILTNEWKALHYSDIANKVKEIFWLKSIKVLTIHNELVKWKEFVNVWMWIYGLKDWGYKWENTLEAIINIIKSHKRAMKISEITKEVLKERRIREVTILIVLQKYKNVFERVSKWIYKLKE